MIPASWWRLAAGLWAAGIFVSGVLPTESTVESLSGGHEAAFTTAAHFLVYAALGFVLVVAMGGWGAGGRSLLIALLISGALGGAIEVLQIPLPYRDAQIVDLIVDVAGAVTGLAMFSAVAPAVRSRSHLG